MENTTGEAKSNSGLKTISRPGAVLVVKEFSLSRKSSKEISRSLELGTAAADSNSKCESGNDSAG